MSYLIAYLDPQGNVKIEDSDEWGNEWKEPPSEDGYGEGLQVVESEWFDNHEAELEGLVGLDEILANGKGDTPRPVDPKKWENFDKIFGTRPKHVCKQYIKNSDGVRICYHCSEPAVDQVIDRRGR